MNHFVAFLLFALMPIVAVGKPDAQNINNAMNEIWKNIANTSVPVLKERMKRDFPKEYNEYIKSDTSDFEFTNIYNNLLAEKEFERLKLEYYDKMNAKAKSVGREVIGDKDKKPFASVYVDGMNVDCVDCLVPYGKELYSMYIMDYGNYKGIYISIMDKYGTETKSVHYDLSYDNNKSRNNRNGGLVVDYEELVRDSYDAWWAYNNYDNMAYAHSKGRVSADEVKKWETMIEDKGYNMHVRGIGVHDNYVHDYTQQIKSKHRKFQEEIYKATH